MWFMMNSTVSLWVLMHAQLTKYILSPDSSMRIELEVGGGHWLLD